MSQHDTFRYVELPDGTKAIELETERIAGSECSYGYFANGEILHCDNPKDSRGRVGGVRVLGQSTMIHSTVIGKALSTWVSGETS